MKFRNITGSPLSANADLVAIAISGAPKKDPGFKAANDALGGVLTDMVEEEHFTGKKGQALVAATYGDIPAARVALLGAGPKGQQDATLLRDLGARAVKLARAKGAETLCLVTPSAPAKKAEEHLQRAVEGCVLGSYRFDRYKKPSGRPDASEVLLSTDIDGSRKATKATKEAIRAGEIVGKAICRARDFINEPAAAMTPSQLATIARGIARKHSTVKCKVLSAAECEKLGMGMFLGVAKGSDEPAKFIHLTYTPKKAAKKKVALIGKGITFDSGGYSLKPSAGMEDMKIDMSGAAAVVAALEAVASLGVPYEVHAVTAACENMVSGGAYKLGDVLVGMDGTTVEINNTDAEGRLTLGDALSYTRTRIKPDEMFDFATLTGACMVALGPYTAGVMSKDEGLVKRWLDSADRAGEDMWRLPLNEKLREQLKSKVAMMRNTGERWGGAITAGLFLNHFAGDESWVHVDIAGPATASSDRGAIAKGGVGFGVATICEYLSS